MSTLRVNTLQNTSTTDGGISINNSGHVTVDGVTMPSAGPLSNRNLIINGSCQVAQRGAGPITFVDNTTDGEGILCVDRFEQRAQSGLAGAYTVSQSTDGPDGFGNSYNVNCTTAGTPTGSNIFYIRYYVEAQDIINSGWDHTDSNSELTFSFYVKADHTATYCVAINVPDTSTNSFVKEYTIAAADTWQRVSFQIPGNSGLTINNDNGAGLQIRWMLLGGSGLSTATDGVWNTSSNPWITSNQDNFAATVNNDIWITGVQLEVGSVATTFEHKTYAEELRGCQRYFQGYDARNATNRAAIAYDNYDTDTSSNLPTTTLIGVGTIHDGDDARIVGTFSVPMRARPTITVSDIRIMSGGTLHNSTTIIDSNQSTIYAFSLLVDNASSMTAAQAAHLIIKGNGYVYFSAEL